LYRRRKGRREKKKFPPMQQKNRLRVASMSASFKDRKRKDTLGKSLNYSNAPRQRKKYGAPRGEDPVKRGLASPSEDVWICKAA